jgi:nicotinamidase-related amidase
MKNKFTVENAAMLLIDHQVGTINLAKNIPHAEIIRNMRALARVAVETGMPIVLTSSLETEFQGLLLDDLKTIAPEAYEKRVKRFGIVDAWEDENFKAAVAATGRKKLIMAGLTNDVCIVFPSISATEEGYEVQVAIDAGGSPTQIADEVSTQRMKDHGVTVTVTTQIMAELANLWSEGAGPAIQKVLEEEILSVTMSDQTLAAAAN